MYYSYEAIMVNEFSDLEYSCSTSDLVPSGPNIDSIGNQVCAIAGAMTGKATVSGADHLRVQYDFDASHLWRNVGVNLGIFVFFAISTGVSMEMYKPPPGKSSTVQYRKRDATVQDNASPNDNEIEKGIGVDPGELSRVLEFSEDRLNKMYTHDGRTLAWKDLSLDVEAGGEPKRLLNNLSGESI